MAEQNTAHSSVQPHAMKLCCYCERDFLFLNFDVDVTAL